MSQEMTRTLLANILISRSVFSWWFCWVLMDQCPTVYQSVRTISLMETDAMPYQCQRNHWIGAVALLEFLLSLRHSIVLYISILVKLKLHTGCQEKFMILIQYIYSGANRILRWNIVYINVKENITNSFFISFNLKIKTFTPTPSCSSENSHL